MVFDSIKLFDKQKKKKGYSMSFMLSFERFENRFKFSGSLKHISGFETERI